MFVEIQNLHAISTSLELFPHEDSELIDLAGEDLFSSFGPVSPPVSSKQLTNKIPVSFF